MRKNISEKVSDVSNVPHKNHTELSLKVTKSQKFTINTRSPKWAENIMVLVNGKSQTISTKRSGYISLTRNWKKGDKISVNFSTKTRLEYLPDGSNWAAFVHSPIVLAAKTSTENLDGLFADDSRMGHEAKGQLSPLIPLMQWLMIQRVFLLK